MLIKRIWVFCLVLLLFACKRTPQTVVDFQSPTLDSIQISFHQDEAIHVAIASMSSPRESFMYYNELLQFVSEIINVPIHYIQKETYEDVNQLLLDGAVDFAFICSGAYVDAVEDGNVKLLAVPMINDTTIYNSYIISNNNSEINKLGDLKDKSFAFTDPLSFSGYNYPLYRLQEIGWENEDFFSRSVFTFGHDLSIEMVNRGIIDAASVNSLIYDYLGKFNSKKIENINIIEKSEGFGAPPIVCPANIDVKRYKLYQNIFLNLHKDRIGMAILDRLNVDRYEIVDDSIYDGIRTIKSKVHNENN